MIEDTTLIPYLILNAFIIAIGVAIYTWYCLEREAFRPYYYDEITSDDLGNVRDYLDGHAWIDRVKANTKYSITVREIK